MMYLQAFLFVSLILGLYQVEDKTIANLLGSLFVTILCPLLPWVRLINPRLL